MEPKRGEDSAGRAAQRQQARRARRCAAVAVVLLAACAPRVATADSWTFAGLNAGLVPGTTHVSSYPTVVLADGRVLLPEGGSVATQVFDPTTNTWSDGAPMAVRRGGHTVTLLADGRVLVTGGFGSALEETAEIYDPASDTWSAADSMSAALSN